MIPSEEWLYSGVCLLWYLRNTFDYCSSFYTNGVLGSTEEDNSACDSLWKKKELVLHFRVALLFKSELIVSCLKSGQVADDSS